MLTQHMQIHRNPFSGKPHSGPLHGTFLATLVESLPGRRLFAPLLAVERFLLTQMSARALRVPPAPPPFTQKIHQALCSHSLERESSLLAVCYDLQVVCKSYSHINFCCSRKAICFVNNLTFKDAETAMANGR